MSAQHKQENLPADDRAAMAAAQCRPGRRLKPVEIGAAVWLFLLGAGLGAFVTASWWADRRRESPPPPPPPAGKSWPPDEFQSPSGWSFLRVSDDGWSTGPVGSFEHLDGRLSRPPSPDQELVIPIFPTVYAPKLEDKLYYDAILESSIKPGDKVLVIGTGSGADAWVASLKSRAPVHVVEINPMAIANARVTARLGRFDLKAVVGDVTTAALPEDFGDFDFVLWNMPFVWKPKVIATSSLNFEANRFHDGDDGTLLKKFLARLPSLLKRDGRAILLNGHPAIELINSPGAITKSNHTGVVFVLPNQSAGQ